MDGQSFSNWTSGIESLAVSLAVVVGGLWTVFTFGALRQARRARAEVADLEQRIRQQGVVVSSIKANQEVLPGDAAYYISAVVDIQNRGNRQVNLKLPEDGPFSAAKIAFDQDDRMVLSEPVSAPLITGQFVTTSVITLFPGDVEQSPFCIRVTDPGLYLLTFMAEISREETDTVAESLGPQRSEVDEILHTSNAFFVVTERST